MPGKVDCAGGDVGKLELLLLMPAKYANSEFQPNPSEADRHPTDSFLIGQRGSRGRCMCPGDPAVFAVNSVAVHHAANCDPPSAQKPQPQPTITHAGCPAH
jgi:hypothetical protein